MRLAQSTIKRFSEQKKSLKKITIIARDREGSLVDLINYIKDIGNVGHSFDIVVDPDNSYTTKRFGWDGDGTDMIKSIKVEDVEGKE